MRETVSKQAKNFRFSAVPYKRKRPRRLRAVSQLGRHDELPVVAARKKPSQLPLIERIVVWLEHGGDIVLARRTPDGLFGGLWELPPLDAATALEIRWE